MAAEPHLIAGLRTSLARALEKSKADGDPCAIIVGPAPLVAGLRIRPRVLEEREDGTRAYSLNVAQVRKVLGIYDFALAAPEQKSEAERG